MSSFKVLKMSEFVIFILGSNSKCTLSLILPFYGEVMEEKWGEER